MTSIERAPTGTANSDPFADVLQANQKFAERYRGPRLEGRAARGLAVLTCMDSRIDPLSILGLRMGDAKLLRNAGARVSDDVLRTLLLATRLLDVERVMIIAHTDCRMTKTTDDQIHATMTQTHGLDTRSLDFGTISDQRAVLTRDVQRIRSSPYLPSQLAVIGCVYDLETGLLQIECPLP